MPDNEWLDEAECRGSNPNLFFWDKGIVPIKVQEMCGNCTVRAECIDYATINRESGYYGTTERERRRIRKLGITGTEYLERLDNGEIAHPKRGRPSLRIV